MAQRDNIYEALGTEIILVSRIHLLLVLVFMGFDDNKRCSDNKQLKTQLLFLAKTLKNIKNNPSNFHLHYQGIRRLTRR